MRRYWMLAGGLLIAAVALMAGTRILDEPLRASMERMLNARVKGYSFHIDALHFNPFGFAVELKNLTVRQRAVPEPPVAMIAQWKASLEWKALLFGRLVNNQYIEQPVLHLTRTQARKEYEDETPVAQRGWQDAVQAIYPFKIDEVEIVNGTLTYLDEAHPERPVQVHHFNLTARNIRNVHSRDRQYPSDFQFDGELLGAGQLRVTGHADFLAEPHPGIKGDFHLENTPLGGLLPVTGRYNIQLQHGALSADGTVEFAPHQKKIQIASLVLKGVRVDYVHSARTQKAEERRAKEAIETGKRLTEKPTVNISVDQVRMIGCEFGYVNQAADPPYRLFLSDADAALDHFSNRFSDGTSHLSLKGRFMGSGTTEVKGEFRPEGDSPDFNISIAIVQTHMKALNDLWRAYGNFDVAEGRFSFYSELGIKSGAIRGYFKPLFKDVEVYNERQDADKGFFQRLYEWMAGDVMVLLSNVTRDEVATKTAVSGKLTNPETDTAEAILGLIQNAFFKSILPGLDRELVKNGKA